MAVGGMEEGRTLPLSGLLPKCPQQTGLGKAIARSQEFHLVSCTDGRDPSTGIIPGYVSRKLNGMLRRQDSTNTLVGIQVLQKAASLAMPQCLTSSFVFNR